ncbi:aquaporin [Anthocerotibacter panamensis]|uniref:aquaporin n=1 Tax=Anthocerotibacter panamensis TaxID=2857077 RepID=UPI001C40550F|nr:aquaporin [Anthocerotibacter panamensis]
MLRLRWTEYLIEAWGLGTFLLSAGMFSALFTAPSSRLYICDPWLARGVMGMVIGLTAIGITYSPWGKRSGSHLNPAVTLTFLRLGKITPVDSLGYVLAQIIGGLGGVLLTSMLLGMLFTAPPVNYIVTVPGSSGVWVAFGSEVLIALGMMSMVLWSSNHPRWRLYTGILAGCLVCLYVVIEAPLSGFGMNPARSLASALPSGVWTAFWIYLSAPLVGMLLAAEIYVRTRGLEHVYCAKLQHSHQGHNCIFNCNYGQFREQFRDSFK